MIKEFEEKLNKVDKDHEVYLLDKQEEINKMYEKLKQAKKNSYLELENIFPEDYKFTIEQVIKICKLDTKQFKKEVNLTLKELNKMQDILKEQQRRLLDPSIAIAEERQIPIDKEEKHLFHLIEKLQTDIESETNEFNKVKAEYLAVKKQKNTYEKAKLAETERCFYQRIQTKAHQSSSFR